MLRTHRTSVLPLSASAAPAPIRTSHSFDTHLLQAGYDIRTIPELLGQRDVATAMIYTHVLNRGGRGIRSPLDALPTLGAGLCEVLNGAASRPTVLYLEPAQLELLVAPDSGDLWRFTATIFLAGAVGRPLLRSSPRSPPQPSC